MGGVVDVHVHFFARAFFDALAARSPLPGGPAGRLARVAQEAGLELPDPAVERHVGRWLAELDRHGVEHAVVFASAEEEVEDVARALALGRGRLTGLALLDPRPPDRQERVRALLARGYRGVLVFPALHEVRLDAPEVAEVCAALEPSRGFVVAHCGLWQVPLRDRFALPRPRGALGDPLDLVPTAARFPGVRFVVPHLGAGMFREALLAGAQCPNVHLDTSSSNAWIRTQGAPRTLEGVLGAALDALGPGRLLFGTDSSTFPRGWRHDLHAAQRACLDRLGVPAPDQARVFGGNARELLGLAPAGP